jgi:tetrapyrrole methylase family protein/MazG family protein
LQALRELVETLRFLRSENGCPWDRKQTFADLCRYLIDESYELQEHTALTDPDAAGEEMGDVLFVALCAALYLEERAGWSLERIAAAARAKIVRRHPHVFGDRTAKSPEESLRHWEDVKAEEARARGEEPAPFLRPLPGSVPALRRALAVQRRVAEVGFEWETVDQVWAKLLEESRELHEVLPAGDPARIQDELGDILFSVVNLARFLAVDPEAALAGTVTKFSQRFGYVERGLTATGRDLKSATLAEMDALWEESKRVADLAAPLPAAPRPGAEPPAG